MRRSGCGTTVRCPSTSSQGCATLMGERIQRAWSCSSRTGGRRDTVAQSRPCLTVCLRPCSSGRVQVRAGVEEESQWLQRNQEADEIKEMGR